MNRFKLGLSGCGGGLESVSTSHLLSLAERAEELGYDALWINEEHFQGSIVAVEGRRCLSPLILASAILARTTRIRVGFSVLLLSLHQPIRLAEEIASLDVLSGGRVDFGVSRGANRRYSAAFNPSADESSAAFQDTLALIHRAWSDTPLAFGGQPPVSIEPKPVQRPGPPVFVGTYTEETVAWAAQAGHRLICHGITSPANQDRLMRAFALAGGDPATVPFGRFVYVGEDDDSARAEVWPTILRQTERLRTVALFNRSGVITERDLEPETFYRDMVIAGGPESCARQILDLRERYGVRYLNALTAFFGFLPLPLLERSIERLALRVRPLVEDMM